MTTQATDVWREYMDASCAMPDYPSAVLSGIAGDRAHAKSGGYHISIEDQSATNYSVTRPDDKAPPGKWSRSAASAGDKSMSTVDMIKEWNRYLAVWENRDNDPRAKYVNGYNGWNGTGEAERLDFVSGTRKVATADHKWHSHREGRRRYANDPELKKALLSIERGETVAQYLAVQTVGGSRSRVAFVAELRTPTGSSWWTCAGPAGRDPLVTWDDVLKARVAWGTPNDVVFSDEAQLDRVGGKTTHNAVTLEVDAADKADIANQIAQIIIQQPGNDLSESDLDRVKAKVQEIFADAGTSP